MSFVKSETVSFSSDIRKTQYFCEPKDDIKLHELAEIVPYLIKSSKNLLKNSTKNSLNPL